MKGKKIRFTPSRLSISINDEIPLIKLGENISFNGIGSSILYTDLIKADRKLIFSCVDTIFSRNELKAELLFGIGIKLEINIKGGL
ncbi:MAG: hypothetical protein IPP81_19125 [Chitinophagaceae bacterium]|nr:hypothetical protein [Chitinophagaceae bacterium]